MKRRVVLPLTLIAVTSLCAVSRPALGQEEPLCSLDQISEALNNLECRVEGSFVSVESVSRTITAACAATTTAELCYACFHKGDGKAVPAFKSLIKLKILPRNALRYLRAELELAAEETCSSKPDDSPEWEDNDDNSDIGDRPERGRESDQGRGRGRGRGGSRSR